MSSGKIFAGQLPVAANQTSEATPAAKVRTVSINVANPTAAAVTLKVYVASIDVPADADRIEPDITIPAGGLYSRDGTILGPTERVILHASAAVPARITCFEEPA